MTPMNIVGGYVAFHLHTHTRVPFPEVMFSLFKHNSQHAQHEQFNKALCVCNTTLTRMLDPSR